MIVTTMDTRILLGGCLGVTNRHIHSAQSPWRLKKKRFEAGQAQVKISCQKLKSDAQIQNVSCYSITALSFVPNAKMEQY